MALIVEDGTIVTGAESYVSAADADTYHTNRLNTAWTTVTDVPTKEAALRKAADYMQGAYRGQWKGFRTLAKQALDWPRQAVLIEESALNAWVDLHTIPVEVKNAQCELALRALSGDLAPDLTRMKSRTKIGDIDISYDDNNVDYTRFRAVDNILRPYLKVTGPMTPLYRS